MVLHEGKRVFPITGKISILQLLTKAMPLLYSLTRTIPRVLLNTRKALNLDVDPGFLDDRPLAVLLAEAETRLLDRESPASYREFTSLLERMLEPQREDDAAEACRIVLRLCQRLYGSARSFEALPFGRANLELAQSANDDNLIRWSHTACGLLLADTADIAGAIEHHAEALRLAAAKGDTVGMSRVWNNIGHTFCVSGSFSLAAACFRRVLALLSSESAPIFSRYTAYGNLAHCLYHLDEVNEGLHFAKLAQAEMTADFLREDPHCAVLLHRNCVKLFLASGQIHLAKEHVDEVMALTDRVPSPRASIAAATTQAAYEMAMGQHDIGLTRLDQALVQARGVPTTLRDTLVSVIRAEEKAGFPAHALVRLNELSDHIYRTAIGQIRMHVELSDLQPRGQTALDQPFEQAKVRLISHLAPPSEPPEWKTLQRLAVSAGVRIDSTGWHGVRVGALTKALALEFGLPPLQALEYGMAAQIHDIGMASVPERIVMQERELNDVERTLVEKHTAAGAEMLSDDRHPRILIARDVAKFHHAHWDGGGHPGHVARQSIPLAARMCAVADTYDTLVTDRPYRKACSMSEALRELNRISGTQLDPELVVCFERMIKREAENEGIDPSAEMGLDAFQQLISALTEDRGFL